MKQYNLFQCFLDTLNIFLKYANIFEIFFLCVDKLLRMLYEARRKRSKSNTWELIKQPLPLSCPAPYATPLLADLLGPHATIWR